MPIETNNVARHKDIPSVRFGTGDILITNGPEYGSEYKILVLAQHTPKPESEWNNDISVLDENGERTTDAHDKQIHLYFNNVKSVDNVIHRLEMIKSDLQISPPSI